MKNLGYLPIDFLDLRYSRKLQRHSVANGAADGDGNITGNFHCFNAITVLVLKCI